MEGRGGGGGGEGERQGGREGIEPGVQVVHVVQTRQGIWRGARGFQSLVRRSRLHRGVWANVVVTVKTASDGKGECGGGSAAAADAAARVCNRFMAPYR